MRASDLAPVPGLQVRHYVIFAVTFFGSPVVGAIVGSVVMSWLMPGEAEVFGIIHALFGGGFALAVTLQVSLLAYCLMVHHGCSLIPWFVVIALVIG